MRYHRQEFVFVTGIKFHIFFPLCSTGILKRGVKDRLVNSKIIPVSHGKKIRIGSYFKPRHQYQFDLVTVPKNLHTVRQLKYC
jgi:hypothetical protein